MYQKENNYAFIDSTNLNLAIINQGWVLDFAKFRKYLADRFFATKAYLFIGYVSSNESLYGYLQESGYILIFKPTLKLPNETYKGNVDAELVLHTMIQYNNYDKAIIVSGDGDFYCLIEYLDKQKKIKRLIVPNKYRFSSLLRKFSHLITFLNNTENKLSSGKSKRGITAGQNPLGGLSS